MKLGTDFEDDIKSFQAREKDLVMDYRNNYTKMLLP